MDRFIKKIKDFKFKQNFLTLLSFFIIFLTLFMILVLLSFILISLNKPFVFYFIQLIKFIILFVFGYLIYRMFKSFISLNKAAKILDERNQDKGEIILNSLELLTQKDVNKQILGKIIYTAEKKLKTTNLKPNYLLLKKIFPVFFIIFMAYVSTYYFSPTFLNKTILYLLRFKPPEKEHKKFIQVQPGNKLILINSSINIKVLNPEKNVPYFLYYRVDKIWRKTLLENYSKTFNNLDFSFDYYVQTPYAKSDTFKIKVYELPAIKKIRIKYEYPSYTNLKTYIDTSGSGNIVALKNTKVNIYIQANNPIKSAEMFFSYNKHLKMNRIDKKSFDVSFFITKDGYYHIKLIDILNNQAEEINYSITMIKDEYPEIEFTYPAKDTILNKDMKISLKMIASDDFGLKDPILHYQINDKKEKKIPIKNFIPSKIANINFVLNLNEEELFPGDNVLYWAQISDNNPKPQIAYSSKYLLKFPSIQEIYKEIEQAEKEKEEKLAEIYKKSKKLQKEFDLERKKVLRKNKLNWENKEKLKELLKKQKSMAKTVEKIAEEYKKLIKKMEKNKTVTKETLEKLKKIEEMMKDINNEKLQQLLKKIQEKLEKKSIEDLKKAMEKMKFSLEEFNKKLEETIKLLKQIKKEEALEKSLELLKETKKLQEEINQKTKNGKANKEELAKKQGKVGENLKNLKDQLNKTSKLMDDKKDKNIKDALTDLQKQMEQDSLSQNIKKSKMQIQKGNMKQAKISQQKIMQSLEKAQKKLQAMLSSMSGANSERISDAIKNTILRLLLLSKEIGKIDEKINNDPPFYTEMLIDNYEGFSNALKKLYSTPLIMLILGQKFITDVSTTMTDYKDLLNILSSTRVHYNVRNYTHKIFKDYNILIFDLIQSKKNMNQQGGASSGMEQLMQALQNMGQQQMMINMLTMQMLKQLMNNGGRMTNEMRMQAQRLAEEEGRMAENLKRMLQTNQEAQKKSNFLENIAKELEEISRQLKANRIDNRLIDRQKRILSRLLDAQKSIHRRGFSKKRKSEISEKKFIGIKKNNRQKMNDIKIKSLLKESEQNYPIEYRKLIDEYLKKLSENR